MSRSEFDALETSSLEAFVSHGFEEGTYLDYKRTIKRPLSKDAKKELLKDVSGFANSAGGLIIFGSDEPKHGVNLADQLIGLQDGPELAGDIERVLTSCLDPRIPGLGVRCIPLSNTLHSIVIHVPPSNVKPHMVTLDKKNQFFQRHSESTEIMNSQEVKGAVLSAYSRDDVIAGMHAEVMEKFHLSNFNTNGSCIVLQAIPLTEPVDKWDVFGSGVEEVLRGRNSRADFIKQYSLTTGHAPGIDVEERFSYDKEIEPRNWTLYVKSNGHVYLFTRISSTSKLEDENLDPREYQLFRTTSNQIFCAFGAVVDELLASTKSSHGYRVSAFVMNSKEFVLFRKEDFGFGGYSEPLARDVITIPVKVALPGKSVEECCKDMGEAVYQAFGVLPADSELAVRGYQ